MLFGANFTENSKKMTAIGREEFPLSGSYEDEDEFRFSERKFLLIFAGTVIWISEEPSKWHYFRLKNWAGEQGLAR